ncbi:MAG: hypothetical protein LRZ85_03200 [Alphaproteobacteria bacterium]|nr:hypothetical protein [Alphaproteobacteria bacterium]MCD8526037.1 hypothetical protein [Alphaproteobacteria bacterium]MCD8570607.1 hypothetical protein [Alphaproteobacteria bacterium]
MRFSKLHLPVFTAVASVYGAAAAFAVEAVEEIAHHGEDIAAHAEGHAPSGLPQLDPSTYPSQIFWLVVMFIVLYTVFSRRILPVISGTLENRREHIESDFSSAENLQREAADVHEAYEKILHDARLKTDALYADIEDSIQKKSAKEVKAFHERMEKETRLTEARIEKMQKDIRGEMDGIVAEVARQAAEKIIGVSADLGQIKTMIKDLNDKPKAA